MKYLLLGWNALLTVCIAYLILQPIGVSSEAPESDKTDTTLSSLTEEPINKMEDISGIVFINTDTLFAKYDLYEDLQNELIAEKTKMEGQYKRKLVKLEKEYMALREKAPFMTQSQGEAAQADLMKKQQDLVKMEQDLASKFKERESEMVDQIQRSIEDHIKSINQNGQYHFVLGKSSLSGILFASESRDITEKVVAGLNESYKKSKEKGTEK